MLCQWPVLCFQHSKIASTRIPDLCYSPFSLLILRSCSFSRGFSTLFVTAGFAQGLVRSMIAPLSASNRNWLGSRLGSSQSFGVTTIGVVHREWSSSSDLGRRCRGGKIILQQSASARPLTRSLSSGIPQARQDPDTLSLSCRWPCGSAPLFNLLRLCINVFASCLVQARGLKRVGLAVDRRSKGEGQA